MCYFDTYDLSYKTQNECWNRYLRGSVFYGRKYCLLIICKYFGQLKIRFKIKFYTFGFLVLISNVFSLVENASLGDGTDA